jgi:hypothetical protein
MAKQYDRFDYAKLTDDQIIIRIANCTRRLRQASSDDVAMAELFAIQELNAASVVKRRATAAA